MIDRFGNSAAVLFDVPGRVNRSVEYPVLIRLLTGLQVYLYSYPTGSLCDETDETDQRLQGLVIFNSQRVYYTDRDGALE